MSGKNFKSKHPTNNDGRGPTTTSHKKTRAKTWASKAKPRASRAKGGASSPKGGVSRPKGGASRGGASRPKGGASRPKQIHEDLYMLHEGPLRVAWY